jgi:hypothetical protein
LAPPPTDANVALDRVNLVHRVCRHLGSERRRDLRALAHGPLLANPASGCRAFALSNGREHDLAAEMG